MVLAPGGENLRPELDPARRSVAIRLTRRNRAVPDIQALWTKMRRLETPEVVGTRKPSTAYEIVTRQKRRLVFRGVVALVDGRRVGFSFDHKLVLEGGVGEQVVMNLPLGVR